LVKDLTCGMEVEESGTFELKCCGQIYYLNVKLVKLERRQNA